MSDGILHARPDDRQDDPSEIAAQKEEDEVVWEKILQRAESSTERARLINMADYDRRQLIQSIREQHRDADAAGCGRGESECSQRS